MNKYISLVIITLIFTVSCNREYKVKDVSCSYIDIDSIYNIGVNAQKAEIMAFYKQQVDSIMNKQLGVASQELEKGTPEGLLSNLSADILLLAGSEYTGKQVDFSLINNGGLRTSIQKGPITLGDIYKVFPFENSMTILTLTGSQVKEVFNVIVAAGGEAVGGCKYVAKNKKLQSLTIQGKPVNDNDIYTLATIDYLADGNSGLTILENAQKRVDTGILMRDVMIQYVESVTAQGKEVSSQFDQRAVVLP